MSQADIDRLRNQVLRSLQVLKDLSGDNDERRQAIMDARIALLPIFDAAQVL